MKLFTKLLLSCALLSSIGASAQSIIYSLPFTSATFQKVVDVSRPVGVVAGAGGVNAAGGATYTVPIACPPGTNGLVPALSLAYSSQSGSGVAGMGWQLAGISTITRSGSNLLLDGQITPVSYTYSDKFLLDGVRLMGISGSYGHNGSSYRPEQDDFSEILSYGATGNGPQWFRVTKKDGTVMEYGNTADSRIMTTSGGQVMLWRLNRILDISGNYIDFSYYDHTFDLKGLLKEVRYTGNIYAGLSPYNKISFLYGERLDGTVFYDGGSGLAQRALLETIRVEAENGQHFKTYELKYGHDQINSYLKEIIEKDAGQQALNSTIFKYGDAVPRISMSHPAVLASNSSTMQLADLDGDGMAEIISMDLQVSSNYYTYISSFTVHKKVNGVYMPIQTVPVASTYHSVRYKNQEYPANPRMFQSTDFNGDGLEDILTIEMENQPNKDRYLLKSFKIYYGHKTQVLNTVPKTVIPVNYWANNIHFDVNYLKPHHHEVFFLGDFNGDKKSDILVINEAPDYVHYPQIYEGGTVAVPVVGIDFVDFQTDHFKTKILDFNGDGKSDIMICAGAYYHIYDLQKNASGYYVATEILAGGYPNNWHNVHVGDFNGDGKSDLLTVTGDNVLWEMAISTGKGFVVSNFYFVKHPVPKTFNSLTHDRIVLADFNNDGKTDILQAYYTDTYGLNEALISIYYSRGNGFTRKDMGWNTSVTPMASQLFPGDINGDGNTDLLSKYIIQASPQFIYLHKETTEHLLEKVLDGMGDLTTFSYKSLADAGSTYNVTLSDGYPLNVLKRGWVVSSMSVPNGIGGSASMVYQYENGQVHRSGRGFLGFKKTISRDLTTQLRTENLYAIDTSRYVPYRLGTKTWHHTTGTLLSESSETIDFISTGPQRYYQRVAAATTHDWQSGLVSTLHNTYDAYGNITRSETNIGGQETQVRMATYIAANTPVPARVQFTDEQITRPGQATAYEYDYHAYDGRGRLVTFARKYLDPKKLLIEYTYDTYGNRLTTRVWGMGIGDHVISSSVYDPKGRFPVLETDAVGRSTAYSWNALWGKPLTVTGADGLSTQHSYDGQGRLLNTQFPEGYSVQQSYLWDLTLPHSRWRQHTTHPGRPDVQIWYDRLGRAIQTKTAHLDGEWVREATSYTASGQVHTVTGSHLPSEPARTITYTYDHLQRVLTETDNLSGTTSHAYAYPGGGKLRHTVTLPSGRQKMTLQDATGLILESQDDGGTLHYEYNSWRKPLAVKLGTRILQTYSYNAFGLHINTWDGNDGLTTYEYDTKGRLTKERDANGNEQTYAYDAADRVTTYGCALGTVDYTYHGTGSGLSGQLAQVQCNWSGGPIDYYTYDAYGRLSQWDKLLGGRTYSSTYQYNAYGDITCRNEGPLLVVGYEYDGDGFLSKVKQGCAGNSPMLYQTDKISGLGLHSQYTLGNGKQVSKGLHHGYLTHKYIQGVYDLEMGYDYTTGNMGYRADMMKAKIEHFNYDDLNRLIESSVNGYGSYYVEYDAAGGISRGNIQFKTGIGNYSYKGPRFNGVSSVHNDEGLISQQRQDIQYNGLRLADTVRENGFLQVFRYDGDGARVESRLYENQNLVWTRRYLDSYEETEYAGNGAREYVHYIGGGDGICAVGTYTLSSQGGVLMPLTYYYTHTDHLGSVVASTNQAGQVVDEQNFDAWGRRRNPSTWDYGITPDRPLWMYRGFTGHEHMPPFTLINMNGRMYDPLLGRMLSPDPYIMPAGSQGYNRYTYALNNPLMYTDPDGEFVQLVIVGLVGGFLNFMSQDMSGNVNSSWDGLKAFGIGAAAGIAGAATGGLVAGAGMGGFAGGLVTGASAGFTAGFIGGAGNSWALQNGNAQEALTAGFRSGIKGGVIGALTGGLAGGIGSRMQGGTFWTGSRMVSSPALYACSDCHDYTAVHLEEFVFRGSRATGLWSSVHMGLDMIGLFDPTGVTDATNAVLYAFKGQWYDAGISALAILPYVGDIGKVGRVAAKGVGKSMNQLNKLVKTGKAPKSITRFDLGKVNGEVNHVHFDNGAALNIDGTWKHGSKVLTNKEIKFLQENGWTIPK